MGRQTSIQLSPATERQAEALKLAGFGTLTDIIRVAIDRMYRQECLPELNCDDTMPPSAAKGKGEKWQQD